MTSAPVTSPTGAQPRIGIALGAKHHNSGAPHQASKTHWSAAMEHAARDGAAPATDATNAISPAADTKLLGRPAGHTGKNQHDPATNGEPSGTAQPDAAAAKAHGDSTPKQHAHAHPAPADQAMNQAALFIPALLSGQASNAPPPSALTPVLEHGENSITPPAGKPDLAAHATPSKPDHSTSDSSSASSGPAAMARADTHHEAAASPPAETGPAGPEDAATPGAATPPADPGTRTISSRTDFSAAPAVTPSSGPVNVVPGADTQTGAPPAPLSPANPTQAGTAPSAPGHRAAPAIAKAGAKPVGDGVAVRLADAAAGQPHAAQAAQISALPPVAGAAMQASPVSGVAPVPPAQTGPANIAAAQAASQFAGGAPVPATPSALAAAVLAMHQAGDHRTILSLDPAGLGAMTVHLSMDQGAKVNVQFVPSLSQTAHLLNNNLGDLRQAMTDAGIALGQASVSADGGNAGNNPGNNGGAYFSPASAPRAPSLSSSPTPALSYTSGTENRFGGISAYA